MKTLEPNIAPVEKKPGTNAHAEHHDEEIPTGRPKLGLWALVVGVLVVIGVVVGLVPRLRHREQLAKDTLEMGVPTVEIVSPVPGKATSALTLPAEVKPVVEAPIYARASGFVKKWYADIGVQVKAGEVLADIDTPELNQELEATRAAVVRAEADLALAKTTSERWTELLKTSSVSEQEAAEKQADLKLKAANVDAAKANMQRLTDLQSFAHVTAPFAGTITTRSIDVGDLINATSGRELFRLADVHTLRVFVRVPQSATPNIEKGLQAIMTVPEWPAKKYQARVVRTSGAIDANSRTLLVELEVDNNKDEVLAGSYVQVAFNDIKQDPALVLPSNTLIFRSEGPQVGVVKPNGQVELRNIVLGRDYGRSLEILSGVSATDKVIVNPSDSLTSGATVQASGSEACRNKQMKLPSGREMKRLSLSGLSLSAAAALLLAAGCAVGPDYKRPQATVIPPAYKEGTNIWKVAEPQAHIPKGAWWEVFQDPALSALETEATMANQELKAAVASFEQARALLSVAQSGYYPHLNSSPSVIRQRDSANRPINGVSNGHAETFNTFSFPLDLSYELDVWGRVRRSVESAAATMQASADDLAAVNLSIQAEVANDYFSLRALDSEISLLRSNVVVFQKSLVLTRNRRAGGVASDLDVSQAETILKTTEAQLPAIALQRAKAEHALAVLIGKSASSFSFPEMPFQAQPPSVPSGLPSELLERRPDIAAAERRMASANAGIGVAKAAFYPTIKLNGLAGFESVSAGTLFDWPSRVWAVGPSIKLPIFEGGENRANLTRAQAAYQQTVATYRQSVLVAFSEVEDNLSAQHLLWSEQEAENAALKAAEKTLEIANNRYRAGLVTYLEVATAQNAALERERENVRLRGERLLSTVSLIKSLGGGWENPQQISSTR